MQGAALPTPTHLESSTVWVAAANIRWASLSRYGKREMEDKLVAVAALPPPPPLLLPWDAAAASEDPASEAADTDLFPPVSRSRRPPPSAAADPVAIAGAAWCASASPDTVHQSTRALRHLSTYCKP